MANNKTFRVSLDMKAPTAQRNEWEVVEGDNGNIIEITLTDDGEPVDLTGCKVMAVFGLPTGVTVEQDTDEGSVTIGGTDNNVITIALATGSFSPGKSSSGLMKCEIQVYSGAQQDVLITSAQFTFRCRRAIINDQTIEATNEYPILVELIKQVQGIIAGAQSDWDEADSTKPEYIRNKPTIPAAPKQSDWNEADSGDLGYIKNKPTSMTPTAHASTHAAGGTDVITPGSIGASASNHVHGHITSGGAIPYNDTETIAAGDGLVFADDSDSGKLKRSGAAFASGNDASFLNIGGGFAVPPEMSCTIVSNLNNAAHSANNRVRAYAFGGSATNSPGWGGMCFFFSSSNPLGTQFAIGNNGKIATRVRNSNGTWGNWTEK
jgi:hypothetical protein